MDCVASLHPTLRAWLRDSALAPHVDAYAEHLRKGRYAISTTSRYLSCISHFAQWTTQGLVSVHLIDEKTGGTYSDKIDLGQQKAKDGLDGLDGQNDDIA